MRMGGRSLGSPSHWGCCRGHNLGRHQGCFLGSFQGPENNLVRAALELLDLLRVRGRQVPHSSQGTDRAREGVHGTTGGWPVSLSRWSGGGMQLSSEHYRLGVSTLTRKGAQATWIPVRAFQARAFHIHLDHVLNSPGQELVFLYLSLCRLLGPGHTDPWASNHPGF